MEINLEKDQRNNLSDNIHNTFSSVIADIYSEHHVSPFRDLETQQGGR